MNITLPAYYLGALGDDASLFGAQICFNADEVRHLQAKVTELAQSIPEFREIVVRFHGRADFIVSVPDPDVEALFLNEAGTDLVHKVHAEPISEELLDVENVRTVNLHVTQEGFYVKGFEKYSGAMMETDLVRFTEL